MTVGELTNFLKQYPENANVTMLSLNQDNPVKEDIGIQDVLAIYSTNECIRIVIRPEA